MSIVTVPIFLFPMNRAFPPVSDGTVTLDAAEEFLVATIRIPKTGTLNKITWKTGTITGSSYTLKISVETVAESIGQPVAVTNATKTLYATGAESADITSLTSNTVYHTPINGSSGISVTAGDLVSITFRLTAVDSSSVILVARLYVDSSRLYASNYPIDTYQRVYLGGAWSTTYSMGPMLSLQYSDNFVPSLETTPPCSESVMTWGNATNDRRGIKFKFPVACRLYGLSACIDLEYNANVILYDSDEYTVKSGFPITLNTNKRRNYNQGEYTLIFPTKPELAADTWYRLVFLPSNADTAALSLSIVTLPDDDTKLGIYATTEGANLIYTYRHGVPTSSDHTWVDVNSKPAITLLIDGIDTGSSSSGSGVSRSRIIMG